MVIDKGLGKNSFMDLMETGSNYIDCVKFGFGTAPLYKTELLLYKINLAKQYGVTVMPGGTLLETAVLQDVVSEFFNTICNLGFNAIEVSDGTIELSRDQRTELIQEGIKNGLKVFTEYGKKISGSLIDAVVLADTLEVDLKAGAELLTIEARETGMGVGVFDEQGECRLNLLDDVLKFVTDTDKLIWEAPLKSQQVLFLNKFGPNANLGNISPGDILSLETLRRGLRQDTFTFGVRTKKEKEKEFFYVI
ncbi:phosphosulfolactate synthase [Paenibacillus lentus]|uniref:Phosphosulfolactate synthase n=2 Tax=Paenibacillus lentus TaxID=1338368 RepID=A0A3Q8SEN5_9BACL|nr:phosphosulfolactate synthase [Paenibacillus lentus]